MNSQKIAYIVPSEAMASSVSDILHNEIQEGIIDVMMIDIRMPEDEYRRLCEEGYACIIARAGTYTELKSISDIVPVLEERIRTSDILEMIADEQLSFSDELHIVLHEKTANGIENLTTISNGRIHIYRYSELDALKSILASLPESNVKVFTSGYARHISERTDLELIEFRHRPHTIRETVRTARIFLKQMQENISQVNTLNSIYNNINEGLIIFDQNNRITELNKQAEAFIGMPRTDILGKDIYSIIPNLPEKRTDGSCSIETPTDFTGNLGRVQLSYTVYPFESYRGSKHYMLVLQDITKIQQLERNIRVQLTKKGLSARYTFENILTNEPLMMHTIEKAKTISNYDGSVLIHGESGTGKELFAQSIHNASKRSMGPFVAINCAALTESLLESELFGYVGGAFTGARKEGKAGLFELAHNGTIFLDEINSMPVNLQSKLLRVIETKQVMRVGSDSVIPLNVRVISATNADIEEDIAKGDFRRDLYFRLSTFELSIAPIRERKKDIIMLFKYYLSEFAESREGVRSEYITIDPEFEKQLLSHNWLGNVREIRSVALRYDAFDGDNSNYDILKPSGIDQYSNASDEISENDPLDIRDGEFIKISELSDTIEKLVILSLENQGLSKTEIARRLGISRQALYKKVNK